MDHKYIEDNHLVPRYLADQLTDADREAFEAFCRANPEMFREIEAAARFKVGLANLDEAGKLQPLLDSSPAVKPFLMRHAAVVAGLVVGVGVLYGSVISLRVPAMGASVAEVSGKFRDALPVVSELELMRMRASEPKLSKVPLPTAPGLIALRVLPEDESATSYRATLRKIGDGDPNVVAELEGLEPDDDRVVTVYLNTRKIGPAVYDVLVTPSGARVETEDGLRFEVVATPQK